MPTPGECPGVRSGHRTSDASYEQRASAKRVHRNSRESEHPPKDRVKSRDRNGPHLTVAPAEVVDGAVHGFQGQIRGRRLPARESFPSPQIPGGEVLLEKETIDRFGDGGVVHGSGAPQLAGDFDPIVDRCH